MVFLGNIIGVFELFGNLIIVINLVDLRDFYRVKG